MTLDRSDHLLIPVETLNREFDGKLLLALMAAERGWRPIVGGRTAMHQRLASLPRSVYVAKGVRSGSRLIFSLLEKMGHAIVAFDEEALVRFSDDVFLMKLEPQTFSKVRMFFAWGHDNAQIWRRSPYYQGQPMIEAGNPRVDMMRPELRDYYKPEIDDIRRRFGDFVLINSNFSAVNHFIANHSRFKVAEWAPAEKADFYRGGLQAQKKRLFEAFLELLPALSKAMRPYNIVVRPHPSENPETWEIAAGGLDNVHVLHEGPVVPWLAAARALVHNGCTSAVEAAVIGTPAFAYRPVVSNQFDLPLPNELSRQCFDAESLFASLRQAMSGPRPTERQLTAAQDVKLRELIAAVDGELSCARILDAIDRHRAELAPSPSATWRSWIAAWLRLQRRALARLVRTRLKSSPSSKVYTAHKFPGIGVAEVNKRIARFQSALGRFAGLRARQIAHNIFAIERG
ncbi:MAG: surface carbohydrate biosynthesis protein [Rhodospirillales bacterium]